MADKNFSLSIIIPAFNEELAILKALEDLKQKFATQSFPYEIIVVDDGSKDKTGEIVRGTGGVRLITNDRNMGYGAAIKIGVRTAQYDYIGLIDADGQHDPNDLLRLAEFFPEYDMAVGARQKGSHRDWFRRPGMAFIRWLANQLVDFKIPDLNSGLRIINKKYFQHYENVFSNSFSLSTTSTLAFLKAGLRIKYVSIVVKKRLGKSSVKQGRHGITTILLILRVIMIFNPLKVFFPVSAFLFLFGLSFSIYGVISFHRLPNSGIIIILTSVILFLNGLLADQISSLRNEKL